MRRIAVFSCAVLFLGLLAASVSTARACDPSDFDAPANLIWCEVRFKPPVPTATPTRVFVAEAAPAPVTPVAVAVQKGGDTPGTALEITKDSQTIGPNSSLWYKIGSNGDHFDLFLESFGAPGLGFAIYAPNQNLYAPETKPKGLGTYPANNPNVLVWAGGSFRQIGTWYALVTNTSANALTFKIGANQSAIDKVCLPPYFEQLANGASTMWTACH